MDVGANAVWSAKQYSALFLMTESTSQVVEIIRNNSALKRRVTQTLAYYNSARKLRARNKLLCILGCDCLMSQYSTKSEEVFGRKEA